MSNQVELEPEKSSRPLNFLVLNNAQSTAENRNLSGAGCGGFSNLKPVYSKSLLQSYPRLGHILTLSKKTQRESIPFLISHALLSLGREMWISYWISYLHPLDVLVWTTGSEAGLPCGIIWGC